MSSNWLAKLRVQFPEDEWSTIMRTFLTKNDGQYFLNVEGNEPVACEVKHPASFKDPTIFLPTNPSNRKLFNQIKADKLFETMAEIELSEKATVTITRSSTPKAPSKPLEDFLSDEDKATFIALRDKATAARAEANKPVPMSPAEKAKRAFELAQKKYEELLAAEAAKEAEAVAEPEAEVVSNKKAKAKK